uniref:hypothetical protein n=1 Tax=Alistipes sp. D31t1_170403_E11 TaxID=2787128 RepID=UPI001899869E|nr:hypothetical protein [Alistipes sp. D31t1_170403_E11]
MHRKDGSPACGGSPAHPIAGREILGYTNVVHPSGPDRGHLRFYILKSRIKFPSARQQPGRKIRKITPLGKESAKKAYL